MPETLKTICGFLFFNLFWDFDDSLLRRGGGFLKSSSGKSCLFSSGGWKEGLNVFSELPKAS